LGVYAPEDFPEPTMRDITPEAPLLPARPPRAVAPPSPQAKAPLEVVIGDGWDPAKFPRTKAGLEEALEFMVGAVVDGRPGVVDLNTGLLDTIADKMPQLAERIANLRAAAAEAIAASDDAELSDDSPDDTFPGDLPANP
jgi:hypothetical protein